MIKTRHFNLLAGILFPLLVALFLFALLSHPAVAQSATPIPPAIADAATPAATTVTDIVAGVVAKEATSYPWIMTILAIMGALRVVTKPLMTAIEVYVKSTPSPNDDLLVAKVETSLPMKWLFWALDFFASVKAGPQFTAKPGQ